MEQALPRSHNWLVRWFGDREFFASLLTITVPMAVQNFVMSSINMTAVVLIGQLGETSVAAFGLANQIFFLLQLVLFGVMSGSAIFTAQLWGTRNVASIRKVLGLALTLGLTAASIFFVLAELIPEGLMAIYSEDPAVVSEGAAYLRIFAPGFLLVAVTFCYAAVLRSIGQVRLPVIVSTSALVLNLGLSYVLIFGKLGFPALGLRGAATAALVARLVECVSLLFFVVHLRLPLSARLSELFGFDWPFVVRVLKPVLPVVVNEFLWSMGVTTYNIIYARIGTEAIAAMNIAGTIDNLAMVGFFAIANAGAILIGNLIGAGKTERAYRTAGWTLRVVLLFSLLMGGVVILISPALLSLYKVSPEVIENARRVLMMIALFIWVRASNAVLFLSILRSGGDTRFALFLDGFIIWAVGVPLAAVGAFVFHLPVYWVYLLIMSEELSKFFLALWRFISRKWIHNLAETVG